MQNSLNHKLTNEQIDQIKTDFRMNKDVRITAQLNAVPENIVRVVCGLDKRYGEVRKFTPELKLQIVEDYLTSDLKQYEIALKYNISEKSVTKWTSDYKHGNLNLNGDKRYRKKNPSWSRIVEEWLSKRGTVLQSEFCKEKKISKSTLIRWEEDYLKEKEYKSEVQICV